ncbi:hypothetical protein NE237_012709 [Protea cynaroides]|uniref:DUF4283 domain-containing protein n=1 Tax=Protea cynaroides TaxID=273540 RepID=A0A9Q0GXA4_9MAGN|nr:hypothetical protein NE237_012709 [Protea cynaroides]
MHPPIQNRMKAGKCPPDSVVDELVDLSSTLVGFFMGQRQSFSYAKIASEKQLRPKGLLEFYPLLHGDFAFKFSCHEDKERILESGVFYVGGRLMFIRKWERSVHSSLFGLKAIPLWVSPLRLPLHLWGNEALSSICSVLGKLVCRCNHHSYVSPYLCLGLHSMTALGGQYLIEDDEGVLFNQSVTYDSRPPHCMNYGIIGHSDKGCPSKPVMPPTRVAEGLVRNGRVALVLLEVAGQSVEGVFGPNPPSYSMDAGEICTSTHLQRVSIYRLLVECEFPFYIWKTTLATCHATHSPKMRVEKEASWIGKTFCKEGSISMVGKIALCATIYQIWKERNERILCNTSSSREDVVLRVMEDLNLKTKPMKLKSPGSNCFDHLI